jgi:hypothetical protein
MEFRPAKAEIRLNPANCRRWNIERLAMVECLLK